jgi:hypothetical protein
MIRGIGNHCRATSPTLDTLETQGKSLNRLPRLISAISIILLGTS